MQQMTGESSDSWDMLGPNHTSYIGGMIHKTLYLSYNALIHL